MRMLLAIAAFSGVTFLLSAPGRAQLERITACVEVNHSTITASPKRAAGRSECDAQATVENGFDEAAKKARNAIGNTCLQLVTQNVARATCQAHGLHVATSPNVTLGNPPRSAPGAGRIDSALLIVGFNGVAHVCAVLRKVPDETEIDKQDDNICLGKPRTIAFVRAIARCGVLCE